MSDVEGTGGRAANKEKGVGKFIGRNEATEGQKGFKKRPRATEVKQTAVLASEVRRQGLGTQGDITGWKLSGVSVG